MSYQTQQIQPLAWQTLITVMINFLILIAIGVWVFSQAKKAWRGEEVEKPF